jgi:hypothetical protein
MKRLYKWNSLGDVWPIGLALGLFAVVSIVVVACNSGSSKSSSGSGTVNVQLSDPATCEAPAGPFSRVYVTITDVQANTSATASNSDSGWVDLTPNLSKSPQQIDLLGQANNQCFLATLGDAQQLQAGSYQQIRLMLADNTATVSNNACGSATNCVVLASDSSVHTLQLSSESKTGIKIPSGQIASGAFTIAAGQTKDLDIDFSTCESIVQEGGQYRLKPVLHAGEVSTTSTSINGKVLDNATGNPVSGSVMVAVEQKDSAGVDRVQRSILAGSDGSFVFCPLPSGTYDVVIVGTRSDGSLYEPTVVTGVSVGSTVGSVGLYLPTVALGSTATTSANLTGSVTSQNLSNAGTVADVDLSVLETINGTVYTIPLPPTSTQSAATLGVETSGTTTCTSGTDCVNYTLEVPTGAPYVGAWASSGSTVAVVGTSASYIVDGMASLGGNADCTPPEMKTTATTLATTGQAAVALQALAFTQCQ